MLIGLPVALALTHLISSLLFEVSPHDPATFGAVALVLATTALLACAIPAIAPRAWTLPPRCDTTSGRTGSATRPPPGRIPVTPAASGDGATLLQPRK